MSYTEPMALRYDADWDAIGMARADAAFYHRLAAAVAGPVCEIGAGTGRVLLPIARDLDRACAAVEPSAPMRVRLLRRLSDEPDEVRGRVRAVDGHFAHVPLPDASQGLVFSAFRAFQHVTTVAGQLAALRESWRLVRPGGVLAVDLFEPKLALLCDAGPTEVTAYRTAAGTTVRRIDTRSHRRAEQIVRVDFRWVEARDGGAVLRDEHAHYEVRYTFRHELVHLLHRAGIETFEVLGDFDGSPLDDQQRELIVVATKPLA
jgi:SAM-dependent methyltransferase